MSLLSVLQQARERGEKKLAVLIDPDKIQPGSDTIRQLAALAGPAGIDWVLVGGSLLMEDRFSDIVREVKSNLQLPVVLFPGSPAQLSDDADAVLFLSLISGRNPDLLIGQHVVAAPRLQRMKIEVIPTGYMLVDCGRPTTASYISHTLPIPWNKPGIAAMTALAGQYLGLRCFYLDGGSGAARPVSADMIAAVRQTVNAPIIVGGGIRTSEDARAAWEAGADLIVVGTAWEEDPAALLDLRSARLGARS